MVVGSRHTIHTPEFPLLRLTEPKKTEPKKTEVVTEERVVSSEQ